jgi:hypothetical protein
MGYFTFVRDEVVRRLTGPPTFLPVFASMSATRPIGEAYLSGDNALGEPVWSLKIQGRWVDGVWLFRNGEFIPIR